MANIILKKLSGQSEEMIELQKILEEAPNYFQRVMGYRPGPEEAQGTFTSLSPGKTDNDKFTFGIYLKDKMIGCADVTRGYPTEDIAFIGLLLISETFQGRKLGLESYQKLEGLIRDWTEIKKIRIAIVRTNDIVIPFWEKIGFTETGEIKPYKHDNFQSECVILEKKL